MEGYEKGSDEAEVWHTYQHLLRMCDTTCLGTSANGRANFLWKQSSRRLASVKRWSPQFYWSIFYIIIDHLETILSVCFVSSKEDINNIVQNNYTIILIV